MHERIKELVEQNAYVLSGVKEELQIQKVALHSD